MTIQQQGEEFTKAVGQFFKAIEKRKVDLQLVFRKTMVDLYNAIVLATPVDTGQARAGWTLRGGGLDYSLTLTSEGDAKLKVAPTIIQNFKEGSSKPRPVAEYVFSNSVFHIVFLEAGSSKQQPTGMVSQNLRRAKAHFEEALRRFTGRNQT